MTFTRAFGMGKIVYSMFAFGGYFTWELDLLCFFRLFHRSLRKYHQGDHFVCFFSFPSLSLLLYKSRHNLGGCGLEFCLFICACKGVGVLWVGL